MDGRCFYYCILVVFLFSNAILVFNTKASMATSVTSSPTPSGSIITEVNTVASLKAAVANVSISFVRIVPSNSIYLIGSSLSPITVPAGRTITVYGNNVTFDGEGNSTIFILEAGVQFTLFEANLINGVVSAIPPSQIANNPPLGGGCLAAYASSGLSTPSTISLDRVGFANCRALGNSGKGGGFMYYYSFGSKLSIVRSSFTNCTSNGGGGAVYMDSYLNSASAGAPFTFQEVVFNNNSALGGGNVNHNGGGGAVNWQSSVTISFLNSTFFGNTASNFSCGGAIVNKKSTAKVITTSFIGNAAPKNALANACGSAIALVDSAAILQVTFNDSYFRANANGSVDGFLNATLLNRTHVIYSPFGFNLQVFEVNPPTISPTPVPSKNPTPPTPAFVPPDTSPASTALVVSIAAGAVSLAFVFLFFLVWRYYYAKNGNAGVNQSLEAHQDFVNYRNMGIRMRAPKLIVLPVEIITTVSSSSNNSEQQERGKREQEEEEGCFCFEEIASLSIINRVSSSRTCTIAGILPKNSSQILKELKFKMSCQHSYHAACIIKWCEIENKFECPKCRQVIASREVVVVETNNAEEEEGKINNGSSKSSSFSRMRKAASSIISIGRKSSKDFLDVEGGGGGEEEKEEEVVDQPPINTEAMLTRLWSSTGNDFNNKKPLLPPKPPDEEEEEGGGGVTSA